MSRKSIIWFALIVVALVFIATGGGTWLGRKVLEMHGIH